MKKALVLMFLVSCGSSGGSKSTNEEGTRLNSFNVLTAANLPACSTIQEGALAYVQSELKFYSCASLAWTAVEIKGEKGDAGTPGVAGAAGTAGIDGLKIDEIWRFHVNTFVGEPNISSEASVSNTNIGTVQLVRFGDGSGFVSVNGRMAEADSNSDIYVENFSHSFFLAASATEQEMLIKFSSYANMRMRYKIQLSTVPTLKAVVDIDGNFSNNTDTTYTLTKQ